VLRRIFIQEMRMRRGPELDISSSRKRKKRREDLLLFCFCLLLAPFSQVGCCWLLPCLALPCPGWVRLAASFSLAVPCYCAFDASGASSSHFPYPIPDVIASTLDVRARGGLRYPWFKCFGLANGGAVF